MSNDALTQRINDLLVESDPDKRIALSRRLRSDIWDLMSDEDRGRVASTGFDPAKMRGPLRVIK